jgi:hypothetical protein
MIFVPGEVTPLFPTRDPVADPLNLTLMELASGRVQCRWITNDCPAPTGWEVPAIALYCGHPTTHGSWCRPHHAVVVRPASKMTRAHVNWLVDNDSTIRAGMGTVEKKPAEVA